MRIRSVLLVVGLLWGLALLPVACSPPAPSEPRFEKTQNEKETSNQEKGSDGTTQEMSSDASTFEHSEPIVDPTPEKTRKETIQEESAPEPTTSEALIKEVIPESMFPTPGFGKLSGQCNILDQKEWKSSQSYLFRNTIDFGSMGFDEKKLTKGGQQIWKDGNLGGSSVHSEIFAYEVLHRCESATLLKSESKILYQDKGGKKTDLLVTIDARKIGVSVTRAFHFPPTKLYTEQEATKLLTKKLKDIPLSASNADPKDAWVRSILHIIAYNKQHADTVETAYQKLDNSIKSNIILMVTVTDGKDDYIY